jgi:hypothetical protein
MRGERAPSYLLTSMRAAPSSQYRVSDGSQSPNSAMMGSSDVGIAIGLVGLAVFIVTGVTFWCAAPHAVVLCHPV